MEAMMIFKTDVDGERKLVIDCDIYSPEFIVEDKSVVILDAESVSINSEDSDEKYKIFFEITTDEDHNIVVEFKNTVKKIYFSVVFTQYMGPHWEINIIGE